MKTLSKLGAMLALGGSLFLASCAGEYYVSDQPTDVAYDYGTAPYADGIYVGDDWVYIGGHYVHNRGHWEHARAGHTYVKGSWHKGPKGYAWHRGRWQ
jgi:hypothetical protein